MNVRSYLSLMFKLFCNSTFDVKTSRFCQIYMTWFRATFHNVTKIYINFNTCHYITSRHSVIWQITLMCMHSYLMGLEAKSLACVFIIVPTLCAYMQSNQGRLVWAFAAPIAYGSSKGSDQPTHMQSNQEPSCKPHDILSIKIWQF